MGDESSCSQDGQNGKPKGLGVEVEESKFAGSSSSRRWQGACNWTQCARVAQEQSRVAWGLTMRTLKKLTIIMKGKEASLVLSLDAGEWEKGR